jgi:Domain of unknown function (DU1801)
MSLSKFNPPFTNQKVIDFFEFECPNQSKAVFLEQWIEDTFPDLQIKLAYYMPFFWFGHKKVMYLHYTKVDEQLELELSFVNGNRMRDPDNLFQSKNMHTKAILIPELNSKFLRQLENYISLAIALN